MVVDNIRELFPALHQQVYGKPLVYFDNAATSQKPQSVIDFQRNAAIYANANIHRAVHSLSAKATDMYEGGRNSAMNFIGASSREEVVFTAGTTSAINLVANGFAGALLHRGDKVIVGESEHHSNIVPWQIACERSGAELLVVPVDENGLISLPALEKMLDTNVKMVSVAHISNVLGLKNPIKEIISAAHKFGSAVMIDGAQGILHAKVDVKELDCDFYAFSGHKIYAPTGIGILYGKRDWLEKLPVYMGGGDMVDRVSFSKTTYAPLPLRFEAGTPNFMAAAALTPALEFARQMAQDVEVEAHEKALIAEMEAILCSIDGLKIAGGLSKETNGARVPLFSFSIDGVHPEDAALVLDKMGVAVRSGLMCAEPIVRKYSDNGLLRVSMLPYNSLEEVGIFGAALKKVIKMLR